ncbi:MAG TPA: adenine phosphoribosyltransferase [Ktedonobacterales bacterium]|nr:adenine phosphoribosyltransferase [Ktedonobacterales bacterium]
MSDPQPPSSPTPPISSISLPDTAISPDQVSWLKGYIRDIPDYPQSGILFRDITPLLQNAQALRFAIDKLTERYRGAGIDAVVGIESRGFIFGTPLAYLLGVGFVPVRKKGKLPADTISIQYDLEYGTNVLEIHTDGLRPGQRVLVVDDLLATGGTTEGTVRLVESLGARVVSLAFLIELEALEGRSRLPGQDVFALLSY